MTQGQSGSGVGGSGVGSTTSSGGRSGVGSGVGKAARKKQAAAPSSLYKAGSDRDGYEIDELAIVLSHFDLGVIELIKEFARGSRRAPKLMVKTDKGTFLLKRRQRGKDDPFKVAFCHMLQLYLADKQFPLPHLIGTTTDNNTMLQWKGGIYEVFEYIKGTGYDSSMEATEDSGKILGLFHKLIVDFQADYEPGIGSYHAARSVQKAFEHIPRTIAKIKPEFANANADLIIRTNDNLRNAYNNAAMKANEIGLGDWPMQIIHCDWHPGNMLYRGSRVVAVIDYDTARLQQRIIDAANGVLQFSILGGSDDPSTWPDHMDMKRYATFLQGYDKVNMLSKAEINAIPWLMIEALIAEAAIPIAATGMFARIDGFGFLQMIERKIRWMAENYNELTNVI